MPTRLIVRNQAKAPVLPHATLVEARFTDGPKLVDALGGIDTVLFVSGFEAADRLTQHQAFVDACVEAGVKRAVYTSFFNASPDHTFTLAHDHFHTEAYLHDRGIGVAALRNNFYADILPFFVTNGVIRGPGGDGAFAPVARDDIADVAAALLADPAQPTGRYDLTGPALITLNALAALLTKVGGAPVTYVEETVAEAYASRAGFGVPQFELDGWVTSYLAIAKGELARVTDTVERITGHPATPVRTVLEAALG